MGVVHYFSLCVIVSDRKRSHPLLEKAVQQKNSQYILSVRCMYLIMTNLGFFVSKTLPSRVFGELSCTETEFQSNPWWSVELYPMTSVNKVIVTNRGDCCCKDTFCIENICSFKCYFFQISLLNVIVIVYNVIIIQISTEGDSHFLKSSALLLYLLFHGYARILNKVIYLSFALLHLTNLGSLTMIVMNK